MANKRLPKIEDDDSQDNKYMDLTHVDGPPSGLVKYEAFLALSVLHLNDVCQAAARIINGCLFVRPGVNHPSIHPFSNDLSCSGSPISGSTRLGYHHGQDANTKQTYQIL